MKALREIVFPFAGSSPTCTLALALALAAAPIAPANAVEVGVSAVQAMPIELDWTLHPRGCELGSAVKIHCGAYGTFIFSESSVTLFGDDSGPAPCPTLVFGTETPGVYPMPTTTDPVQAVPASPTSPTTSLLSPKGGIRKAQAAGEGLLELPEVPCRAGSCFVPLEDIDPLFPWMATVDWNQEHGWTTGFTVTEVSGMPTHMFAVDDPELTDILGEAVGDGHLLASLCAIAEAIDFDRAEPPEVINMSFGRLFDPADDDTADGENCHDDSEDTLTCQLSQVIHHLSRLGITFIAAAGNHGNLLFPAAHEKVVPVGSLNLAEFSKSGTPAKSWETPLGTQVLCPGYGICLAHGDDGRERLYAAAAGTSYATAIYSGWLAQARTRDPATGDPLAGAWHPVWSDEERCFLLSQSSGGGCNPVANQILDRILGRTDESCWADSLIRPALGFEAPDAGNVPIRKPPIPTLDEWVDATHLPTPGGNGCVPCAGGGESAFSAGSTVLATGGGLSNPTSPLVAMPIDPGNINIDIKASGMLEDGLSYAAVLFRVADDYYPLLERAKGQGAELDQLAAGEIQSLNLLEFASLVGSGQQPSLVYVVSDTRVPSREGRYLTSTPLLVLSGPSSLFP